MDENEWLADRFEEHRPHLRAVAYRMLGSLTEADDAVQDTWLRLSRAGASEIDNLGGWLTTIVARVCLNMLRSRNSPARGIPRRPHPRSRHQPRGRAPARGGGAAGRLRRPRPPGRARHPVPGGAARVRAPRHVRAALRGDRSRWSVDPPRRRGSSPAGRGAACKGAEVPAPDPDLARQREVVDAFFRAARGGDFDALVALLDPDVVLRSDFGARRPAASGCSVARRPSPGRRARAIPGAPSCTPRW